MSRALRVLAICGFATVVISSSALAAPPPAPELDPASATAGLTILGAGALYLVERFRRRA